jgi:hypothetical protein
MPVTTTAAPAQALPAPGRQPKKTRKAESGNPLEASSNFEYLVNPKRYDVFVTDQGLEILPLPTKLEYQAGLAGVLPVRGDPDGDPTFALAEKKRKGWIEVPEDFEVIAFGERRVGYVHVYDSAKGPDTAHLEVWVRPYIVGGEVFFEKDPAGYHQFLRDVRDKLMPPLDANVRRGLENKLREMRRTATGAASKGSLAARETIGVLEQKLEVFQGGKSKVPPAGAAPLRGKTPKPKSELAGKGDPNGDDDDGGDGA